MNDEPPTPRILSGPLLPAVAKFGAPLAFGMGLQVTFNLVDAYLISRLSHEVAGPALGALGICDQLAAIGSIISYGLSTATAAVMSRRAGRGDIIGARRVAWQSSLMVLALGAIFGLLGIFGSRFLIFDVVRARGRVAELGVEYLQVILTGNVTIFALLHLTTMQRAMGSSKTPASLLVAANVFNLLFAVLLVYGQGPAPALFAWGPELSTHLGIPRLGLVGAAWATVLARSLVLIPLVVLVVRRFGLFRREVRGPVDGPLLRRLFSLGWPTSTQLVVRIVSMLMVQSLVARAYTTNTDQAATTALGVVFRLETMALFISLGWGSAAHTFVAQHLGAGKRERAHRSGWLAAAMNAIMMVALVAVYLGYDREIVQFFDRDPQVVVLALDYIRIVGISYIGLGLGIVLGSAMQGAGATKTTLLIDVVVLFGVLLPLAFGVVLSHGRLEQLWKVVAVGYASSAIVYAFAYQRRRYLDVEVS